MRIKHQIYFGLNSLIIGLFILLILSVEARCDNLSAEKDQNLLGFLSRTIDDATVSETLAIEDLREELAHADALEQKLDVDIEAVNARQVTLNSLLVLSGTRPRDLKVAYNTLKLAFMSINARLEKLEERNLSLAKSRETTQEQLKLVNTQQLEIIAQPEGGNSSRQDAVKLANFRDLMKEKLNLETRLFTRYERDINRLIDLKTAYQKIEKEYQRFSETNRGHNLSRREVSPFSSAWLPHMGRESAWFFDLLRTHLTLPFWREKGNYFLTIDRYNLFSLMMLFLVVWVSVFQLRRLLNKARQQGLFRIYPTYNLPFELIEKNGYLIGSLVFLFGYKIVASYSRIIDLIDVVYPILVVWLATNWALSMIHRMEVSPSAAYLPFRQYRMITLSVRWLLTIYLPLIWWLDYQRFLIIVGQFTLEVFLTILGISLWRQSSRLRSMAVPVNRYLVYLPQMASFFLLLIPMVSLIAELAGFSTFAMFWLVASGKTSLVILWAVLLTRMINDVDRVLDEELRDDVDAKDLAVYQAKWIVIRLLQLGSPILMVVLLILAWGGKQAILSNAYVVVSYKFTFGNMNFSLLSLFQALLILLITSMFTRIWRYIFQKRFLDHSRIDTGLQDSITTITVYVIWGLGILIALNVFGLNPTSLMVVFGALGIGLGFGLQNIFNNFMSGLILLFERPIQVGDDIEINGIWATVQKINVRSTLVQTYDNASLIIPNSDLINNQVTNWSFKDKRLRRQITVGVAYGTDTELVTTSLLDICQDIPNILSDPRPDVLFSDFGDSALIFRLRFWTHINVFIATESEVRMAIDQKFKDMGIVIAFPQTDIHIYQDEPLVISDTE